MTAHLALRIECEKRGKDFIALINYRIKNRPFKVQQIREVVEEMHMQMAFKESLRPGWRSVIKDKRV